MKHYARRLAESKPGFTQGKVYELDDGYAIVADDNGNRRNPELTYVHPDKGPYWQIVRGPVKGPAKKRAFFNPDDAWEMAWTTRASDAEDALRYATYATLVSERKRYSSTTEKTTMLKIENVTFVNGRKLADLSADDLLKLVEDENKKAARVEGLGIQSPALTRIVEKHKKNIDALLVLLAGKLEENEE